MPTTTEHDQECRRRTPTTRHVCAMTVTLTLGCSQGVDPQLGAESNATDSAATDSAATDSAATDSAATDSAATDSAATDSAATDSVATDSATSDSAASDSASDGALTTSASAETRDESTTPETSSAATPCNPGAGTSGSPRTIVEVVELINGLPHPVTIPCVLEALDRPLRVLASTGFLSAQPAAGFDDPRLFILGDGISLTVVAVGPGKDLLEMGELTNNTHSIKGELAFPVTEQLPLDAAFSHIRSDIQEGTVCIGCHNDETPVTDYPVAGAFESVAYRPLPNQEVDLDHVKAQLGSCSSNTEPERCTFYAALFNHGDVNPDRFPDEMKLFQ